MDMIDIHGHRSLKGSQEQEQKWEVKVERNHPKEFLSKTEFQKVHIKRYTW